MRWIDIAPPGTERIEMGELCPGGAVTVRGLTEGEWCAVRDCLDDDALRARRVMVGVVAVEGVLGDDGQPMTVDAWVEAGLRVRSPHLFRFVDKVANAIVARSTPGPGQGA